MDSITTKQRSDLHLSRKLYHFSGVVLIISLFNTLDRQSSLLAMGATILLVVPLDYWRLHSKVLKQRIVKWFGPVMRNEELSTFSAMSYLLFGVLITIYIFPPQVATLALWLLAVGDPASGIVGVLYGKDKILGSKTLQGFLGGFFACMVVGAIYYWSTGILIDRLVLASILTALVGATAELLPLGRIDDNFSFPILAASGVWMIFYLFGGFGG
ncbi:MAG: hypothetical protein COT74_07505 [Bdellovibrionales bacterium CG10_big_fil_rev_8_21_14_0_10_45_34]|nr:MAG: hypothetical protein COT74_07505 [Bdellovibrionales bacterium CG10_big_fil_rev_8_21_14_0_10_45_34]